MFNRLANSCLVSTLVLVAACDEGRPGVELLEGNPSLGISQFRVTESYPELHIVGVNADGQEIAWVDLRVGHVSIPDEELAGLGREMSVRVQGVEPATHTSVGLMQLVLPRLTDAHLGGLLADPSVGAILNDWGIQFEDPRRPGADLDYTHGGSCTGFIPPCGGTMYTGCCLEHEKGASLDRRQTVICGNSGATGNYAERKCKAPNASTTCGTAGPAGCAVCWTLSQSATVLTAYDSGTDTCNWACYQDADGDGFGAGTASYAATCASGYVRNSRDCYDSNASAKPGQTAYFNTHRGDGSFDYNCDGQQTPQSAEVMHGSCYDQDDGWGGRECVYDFWFESGPSCGDEILVGSCNDYTAPPYCFPETASLGFQYCI